MTKTIALCVSFLFLLAARPIWAESLPAAVTTDQTPDKDSPPSMRPLVIPSHGSGINGFIYLAIGSQPHPTVLLLHGFPGSEQNLDVAQAMRRAGWNVLVIHYRALGEAQAGYSFSNSLEDTQEAVAFLRKSENAARYRIDPSRIVLIGHSMGGFYAEKTAALDADIAGVVLISAVNMGMSAINLKTDENKAVLAKGWNSQLSALAGCTGETLVTDLVSHVHDWNFNDDAARFKSRPMLVVSANDGFKKDAADFVDALHVAGASGLTVEHLETDHLYSDHRIALTALIVRWLDNAKITPRS